MNISEIIKLESERKSADTYGRIHFIKEGNFYRAHDWSAWLATRFPLTDAWNGITIIAKKLKEGYIDAWVGFPVRSLEKFVPNDGSITFIPVTDTMIDVVIELTDDILATDPDEMRKTVDEWKESLPQTESKSQKRENREMAGVYPRVTRISDIISHIIAFPIESKSPMEAYDFLRQLRKDVAAIF